MIGFCRKRVLEEWVDDDELGTAVARATDLARRIRGFGPHSVAAPHHDAVGIVEVDTIEYGEHAELQNGLHHHRHQADVAWRQRVVHCAASVRRTARPLIGAAAGSLAIRNGFGSVFVADFLDTPCKPFDGLVPGNAFPLTCAARRTGFASQRITQPVGVIEYLRRGEALCAHAALAARIFWVALDPYELSVLVYLA